MYHRMTPAAVASRRRIVHTRAQRAARPGRIYMKVFMDKTSVDWNGPHAGGRIDEAAFRANLELCIDAGMTGLVVGGCTGEFWAMTADE